MKHGKNNSLKQTKHKRQLKYNRSRSSKTTHKRQKGQFQYGGKEIHLERFLVIVKF